MQYFLRHYAQLSGQAVAIAMEKVKFSGARNRRDAMFIVTSPRSGVRARETESNSAAFNPLSLLWCAGTQLPPQRQRHRTPAAVDATLLCLCLCAFSTWHCVTIRATLFCGKTAEPDYQVVNDIMLNSIILIIRNTLFILKRLFTCNVLSVCVRNDTFTINIFSHFP